jgi:hypothetical protein
MARPGCAESAQHEASEGKSSFKWFGGILKSAERSRSDATRPDKRKRVF